MARSGEKKDAKQKKQQSAASTKNIELQQVKEDISTFSAELPDREEPAAKKQSKKSEKIEPPAHFAPGPSQGEKEFSAEYSKYRAVSKEEKHKADVLAFLRGNRTDALPTIHRESPTTQSVKPAPGRRGPHR